MTDHDEGHPEEMARFFDARASGYDAHMARHVEVFADFYAAVAEPVSPTEAEIHVLDIGSGTGLALEPVLTKAPNARIIAVDLSARMLEQLESRYADQLARIRILRASYLTTTFPPHTFDYALAVMTLHHLLPVRRSALYAKLKACLKPSGRFIEADWFVTPEAEQRRLEDYRRQAASLPAMEAGGYHIDIPLSLEAVLRLLGEAGFRSVEVIWHHGEAAVVSATA